jgi:hypothetical protein|nr:MAG TPA: hypothetical protein [Herelleviridae sp.]
MRLIDADKLKKDILLQNILGEPIQKIIDRYIHIVDNQPTAFDVEKVVKQLKDLKAMYWFSIANTGDKKLDIAYENVGNALDEAIEIVKGGRVDD